MASSFLRFLYHAQQRTTVGRTPLDEWSARRRDLYLTTHDTHNRQISMLPVGFEPTISAVERPQPYALDRAATGTGFLTCICLMAGGTHCNHVTWHVKMRDVTPYPVLICVSCITWHGRKLLETLTLARATHTHAWARNAEGGRGEGQDRTKKTYTWKRRNSFKGSMIHVLNNF